MARSHERDYRWKKVEKLEYSKSDLFKNDGIQSWNDNT